MTGDAEYLDYTYQYNNNIKGIGEFMRGSSSIIAQVSPENRLLQFIQSDGKKKPNFSNLVIQEISQRYNQENTNTSDSLLNLAIRYKNKDAVIMLLNAEIPHPENKNYFPGLLKDLLTPALAQEYSLMNDMFTLLKNAPHLKDKFESLDQDEVNKIFALAAKNGSHAGMRILLEKNLVTNINQISDEMHSPYYYFQPQLKSENDLSQSTSFNLSESINLAASLDIGTMQTTEYLQAKFEELGAEYNEADKLSFAQDIFSNKLRKAIDKKDDATINSCLVTLREDKESLRPKQLMTCLEEAIDNNNLAITRDLVQIIGAENIDFTSHELIKNSRSKEMTQFLMDEAFLNNSIDKRQTEFSRSIINLAHRIGLSGSIGEGGDGTSIKLEGGKLENGVLMLRNFLKQYKEAHPDFEPIYDVVNFTAHTSTINDNDVCSAVMTERLQSGKPILLSTGWPKHAVSLSLCQDTNTQNIYLSFTNRGMGGLDVALNESAKSEHKSGTLIYELSNLDTNDFFQKFARYANEEIKDMASFKNALQPFIEDANLVKTIPAGPQAQGTCSYVNPKRGIEALLIMDRLVKGLDIEDKAEIDKVYKTYKQFSAEDKKQAFNDLITLYSQTMAKPDSISKKQEKDTLEKFIVTVFIQRGSLGYDTESLKKLFDALPKSLQNSIPEKYQKDHLLPDQRPHREGFFSKTHRQTMIYGSTQAIKQNEEKIANLIDLLKSKGFGGDKVLKIEVAANDKITVYTKGVRQIKTDLRDKVFIDALKANVTNIEGEYKFIVNNFSSMEIPGQQPNLKVSK